MALKDVILGYAKGAKGDKGDTGEKGDQGDIGPKGDPGNIADAEITDTYGLLATEGQKLTAQKLFDAIANKITNVLVSNDALTQKLADYMLKSLMSNVNLNSTENVPTSALVYTMQESLNALNSRYLNNAGSHNSIYRGKNLGTSVTAAQYAAIADGTFDDIYIGDYWTINGRKYWAAHADYRLNCGDTALTTHHMLVIPDKSFYNGVMNDTNVTTGAYYGSKMKTSGLTDALATIKADFGADHILSYRILLPNAVSNGASSGWAWYDSQIDLMNEKMVYGSHAWGGGSQNGYDTGADKSQLALFQARPDLITNRENWWLRDVRSAPYFCLVSNNGDAGSWNASGSLGVRPAFLIY